MNAYDFSPMLRYSVGFDRLQRVLETATSRSEVSYPPYNIETDDLDNYRISIAVAGFSKKELDVTVESDKLTIAGTKEDRVGEQNFVHRGIAARDFKLLFNLADYIKIKSADLANGMLVIDLEREVPEALKPRTIDIKQNKIRSFAERTNKLVSADKEAA